MRARNITMVVILFIVLVLVPETNIQAKTKKCNLNYFKIQCSKAFQCARIRREMN